MSRHKPRFALLTGIVLLVFAACAATWKQVHDNTLNRRLIDALISGRTSYALDLVNAGADPNTPLHPMPEPFIQRLSRLMHGAKTPVNQSPTAFLMAFGDYWPEEDRDYLIQDRAALPLMEAMVARGADLNVKGCFGHTPLMLALENSASAETVRLLIDHGADINAKANHGETPLLCASGCSDSVLRLLLDHGADVNARDSMGGTALIYAMRRGSTPSAIRRLIEYGADVNASDQLGLTPLMYVTESPEAVRLLLDHGADANAKNQWGDTVLTGVVHFGLGAEEKQGRRSDRFRTIVRELLAYGANPNVPGRNGESALRLAQNSKDPDLVALLRKPGISVRSRRMRPLSKNG